MHRFRCRLTNQRNGLYLPPRAMIHKIGEEISPELGVLICAVLGNGVRWLRQIGGVSIGQAVVIIGPGQQGLAAAAVAKESGAEPIIVVGKDRDKSRLEMATRFGADVVVNADCEDPGEVVSNATGSRMADLVMDASGHPDGAGLSLLLAGIGATVIFPGLYGTGREVPLELDRVVFREIQLKGVFSHDFRSVEPAIRMASRGHFPFQEMVSHRFPLEQAEHALALAGGDIPNETSMKIVIDPALP